MAALALHYHPLSSYSQKVLIAIDAMGVPVDKHVLNLGDPAQRAAHLARWPTGKMPLLMDGDRAVSESSIIIEYLQAHPARSGSALIPAAADAALQVRLWDRLFDQYVMTPMQRLTGDLLRPEAERDARGVADARALLASSYDFIDRHVATRHWACGDSFSMADCAAAPSLFYAVTYVPLAASHPHLSAYFERLMSHPAVARAISDARPFFKYYPGKAGLSTRFYDPARD